MSTDSTDLFPRVVDVLDRLDATALSEKQSLAQQLTDAVTETCAHQGLVRAPEAIAAAVQAHLANDPLPVAAGPDSGEDWGWARPGTEEERQRRLTPRWPKRVLSWLGRQDSLPGALVLISLASGGYAGWEASTLVQAVGWRLLIGVLTFGVVFFTLLVGTLGTCLASLQEGKNLQKVIPAKEATQRWMAFPTVRQRARRCLSSGVPYFMQGDVDHFMSLIEDITRKEQAQRNAAALQQRQTDREKEEQARMAEIREQFEQETPP